MASAYGVLVLLEILFERVGVTSLYDLHAQAVQCLDRLVNGTMVLVIVCVTKPDGAM
jgi:energy-converting hydrogenase A subunit M